MSLWGIYVKTLRTFPHFHGHNSSAKHKSCFAVRPGSSDAADQARKDDTKQNKTLPLSLDQIHNPQPVFTPLFPPRPCNGRELGRNFGKSGSSTVINQRHWHTYTGITPAVTGRAKRLEIQMSTVIPGSGAPALEVRKGTDRSPRAARRGGLYSPTASQVGGVLSFHCTDAPGM